MSTVYIVPSYKRFEDAVADLESAAQRHGIDLLNVHDLGATLRRKGEPFSEECKVYEVCDPSAATQVMSADMRLNMAVPCRISVYTDRGATRIGLMRPAPLLEELSDEPRIREVVEDVDEQARRLVDEAR
jgi:uncharacterized protein (DUF302 family)